MIIVVCGEDTYRSKKYLNKIIVDFRIKHDSGGLNFSKIDADKDGLNVFMRNLSALPFLSKKRMVVAFNFFEKIGKEEDIKEIAEKFFNAKDAIIVFFEEKSQDGLKKNPLLKILQKSSVAKAMEDKERKKEVFIYDYPPLQNDSLRKWIIDEARAEQMNIEYGAVEILVKNCGNDLWKIYSELQKLVAFSDKEKIITKKAAEIFVENKLEENIFILTDAIGSKNNKESIKILEEFFLNDTAPEYILTMLARHFRILTGARDVLDSNTRATRDDLAEIMNLHPFVAGKSLMQSKKFNLEELKSIYGKILKADSASKTGKADLKILLNTIVAKI